MGFKPTQGNLFLRYLWEHALKELCRFSPCLYYAKNNSHRNKEDRDLKYVVKERPSKQSGQRNGQQKPSSLVMHCHSQTVFKLLTQWSPFALPTCPFPCGENMSICWSHGWIVQSSALQKPSDSKISCHGDGEQKAGLESLRSVL